MNSKKQEIVNLGDISTNKKILRNLFGMLQNYVRNFNYNNNYPKIFWKHVKPSLIGVVPPLYLLQSSWELTFLGLSNWEKQNRSFAFEFLSVFAFVFLSGFALVFLSGFAFVFLSVFAFVFVFLYLFWAPLRTHICWVEQQNKSFANWVPHIWPWNKGNGVR